MHKITVQTIDDSLGFRELVAEVRPRLLEQLAVDHTDFSSSGIVQPLVSVGDWENDNPLHISIRSKKYRPHNPPLPEHSFRHGPVPGGEVCLTCEDIEIRTLLSSGGRGKQHPLGWFQDVANCRSCDVCRLLVAAFKDNIESTCVPSSNRTQECFVVLDAIAAVTPLAPRRHNRIFELRGLLIDAKTRQLCAMARVRPSVTSGSLLRKDRMFSARPVSVAAADLGLARKWIDECRDLHVDVEHVSDHSQPYSTAASSKHLCESVRDTLAENEDRKDLGGSLRLVDVEDGNLSLRPRTDEYVALSYVWPRIEALRLVKSNSEMLHSHGALLKLQHKLPKVIRDAINVTRELGQRYLWVDALCITQDDGTEKTKLINSMDHVYGDSIVTLIVATETEPIHDYGIPGIGGTPRTARQHSAAVEGVQLMTALPGLYPSMKRSVWSTRGWTFQEQLLTRRCLIFSDRQMFFRCPHDYRAEDIQAEGCKGFIRHPARPEVQEEQMQYLKGPAFFKSLSGDNAFHEYSQIVRAYTPRRFTNSSDVLSAFMGVMMAMLAHLPYPQGFFVGLPIHAFDRALLWYPSDDLERRERMVAADGSSTQLPTWSWAGWTGGVDYEKGSDRMGDFDSQKSMVMWWRWDRDHLVPIKDHSRYLTQELAFSWCMLVEHARGMKPTQLIFWGTCVELSVSNTESHIKGWVSDLHRTLPCFALLDAVGDPCGMLPSADRQWAERHVKNPNPSLCQFLLLAYVPQSIYDEDMHRSRWLHPKFTVPVPPRDHPIMICFYSVMLLEFDEEGIAYRRGIGRVHRDAVDRHLGECSPKIIILS